MSLRLISGQLFYLLSMFDFWPFYGLRSMISFTYKKGFDLEYRIYPKYSDTVNVRTPSFFLKRHLFYVPYISGHIHNGIFAVRKCSDTKNLSLISHKTSIFSLPEYFVFLLCLPVFPVSAIDKPLCLISVH